ncbi:MAG: hypothetical protein PVF28_04075 [Thioalkalispiraceae bacterium]|jgi:hypothetical protein
MKFSLQPGAYERHLQRKYKNPLFSAADQALLENEVTAAREKDQQDLRVFQDSFQESVSKAASLADSVEGDVLLDLKEELERLYVTSTSLANDLSEHRQALLKLIELCMHSLRRGAQDDPDALNKLAEESQARQVYFKLLETPLVADLMRGDEIVSAEDLVPTLLSQSRDELVNALELFEPEHLNVIREQARAHFEKVRATLKDSDEIEKRIALIDKIAQTGNMSNWTG